MPHRDGQVLGHRQDLDRPPVRPPRSGREPAPKPPPYPTVAPMPTIAAPSPITRRNTCDFCAPKAMRIPISALLRCTVCAVTPAEAEARQSQAEQPNRPIERSVAPGTQPV